jgi:hypothetical protein
MESNFVGYGVPRRDAYRQAGNYAGRILKGAQDQATTVSAPGPSPTSGDVRFTPLFGGKRTSEREFLHAVYEYTA